MNVYGFWTIIHWNVSEYWWMFKWQIRTLSLHIGITSDHVHTRGNHLFLDIKIWKKNTTKMCECSNFDDGHTLSSFHVFFFFHWLKYMFSWLCHVNDLLLPLTRSVVFFFFWIGMICCSVLVQFDWNAQDREIASARTNMAHVLIQICKT